MMLDESVSCSMTTAALRRLPTDQVLHSLIACTLKSHSGVNRSFKDVFKDIAFMPCNLRMVIAFLQYSPANTAAAAGMLD